MNRSTRKRKASLLMQRKLSILLPTRRKPDFQGELIQVSGLLATASSRQQLTEDVHNAIVVGMIDR
jgi:hypothetical protein